MDMQTDTTTHLAAQEADISSSAIAAMGAATGKKSRRRPMAPKAASTLNAATKIAQALAAVTQEPSTGQDDLKDEVAPAIADDAAPTLADLLAKRNATFDLANLSAPQNDLEDEDLDKISAEAMAFEQDILTTPCKTIDDAVAKVACLAEFVREAGCPDESDVEAVLADIGRMLRNSSHPKHATKFDRRDAHWALVPLAAAVAQDDFTQRLNDLIAKAKAYSAEFVEPADKAHSAADHAKMEAPAGQKEALEPVLEAAWKTWEDHCNVYRTMVDPILELTPSTPKQLLQQVDAYADLMGLHWARNPKAETAIARLGEDEVDEIAEHMHAHLKRLEGDEPGPISPDAKVPDAPAPAGVDVATARAAIVAEAAAYAKLVMQAQDAFNAVDDAWTKDKENQTPGLAEKREALEQVWWDRLDQHHALAKRVLDLPAASSQDISDNVAAYVDIMAPIVGTPDFEPALEHMPTENLLEVIGYLAAQAGADLSEPRAIIGREAIKAAWDQATAKADAELLAAE